MRRLLGGVLGAVAGYAFTTMGLVDTRDGFEISGGNEWTWAVIAVGIILGALLGLTILWRWPVAVLGAIIGLAAGIWLRDNAAIGRPISPVQPPWVFFLLFGLPILGAAGGYLLHRLSGRRGGGGVAASPETNDRASDEFLFHAPSNE